MTPIDWSVNVLSSVTAWTMATQAWLGMAAQARATLAALDDR